MLKRRTLLQAGAASLAATMVGGRAAAAEMPGVTDTEIKIGQTMAYSGPASAYGVYGRAAAAYFRMINESGGINGRKINFISLDDGYSPPKTVEQTRRLVEQENVAFIFNGLGTPPNVAVHQYLNDHKVPQLFVASGADRWGDPKHFPWTMGYGPSYQVEARVFAQAILAATPDAKIAILYQNDDFGRDYVIGLEQGLGAKYPSMVVKEATYEVTDPTINSQVISLQGSGADVFVDITTPKFAAQAIRKVYDIGWKAQHYLSNVSTSVGAVMKPAGLQKSTGIITCIWGKDPTDPHFKDDPGTRRLVAFFAKYMPGANLADTNLSYGYGVAQTLVQVLEQCGNDLSRANIMRQAANLKDATNDFLLPGIKVNTSADNFHPVRQMQLAKFNGTSWVASGKVLSG